MSRLREGTFCFLACVAAVVLANTEAAVISPGRRRKYSRSLNSRATAWKTHSSEYIELAKSLPPRHGRGRSNVWVYPGASSLGSDARRCLQNHPTVKPVAMLVDALLDLTNRSDIAIDPFPGSGSTLTAAEKSGRRCRGVELDPLYVDLIIRRYETVIGLYAILEETGETYAELAKQCLRASANGR